MTMQFLKCSVVLATLALVSARDTTKFMKTVPTISNSLVNLGKMEISFHFSGKHQEIPVADHNVHSEYYSPAEETCPCNSFKPPSFLSDPAEIVNKILRSNDLFKDPTSSICCESSEHLQDNTVVFELNPNNLPTFNAPKPNNIPVLPNILRSPIFPSFMPLNPTNGKPKTVEIFMFPAKKNDMGFEFSNFLKPRKTKEVTVKKSELKFREPKQMSTSVKKDLALSEKKNEETIEVTREELHTDAPPVTNVMNSL